MGRKTRNRINKFKYDDTKKDDAEDYIENNDGTKEKDNECHSLLDVRTEMLKYCDYMSIPLCDYLTHDILEQFIEHLTEKN